MFDNSAGFSLFGRGGGGGGGRGGHGGGGGWGGGSQSLSGVIADGLVSLTQKMKKVRTEAEPSGPPKEEAVISKEEKQKLLRQLDELVKMNHTLTDALISTTERVEKLESMVRELEEKNTEKGRDEPDEVEEPGPDEEYRMKEGIKCQDLTEQDLKAGAR